MCNETSLRDFHLHHPWLARKFEQCLASSFIPKSLVRSREKVGYCHLNISLTTQLKTSLFPSTLQYRMDHIHRWRRFRPSKRPPNRSKTRLKADFRELRLRSKYIEYVPSTWPYVQLRLTPASSTSDNPFHRYHKASQAIY